MRDQIFTFITPFGGSGLGARGFQDAEVRLFDARARFECLGGIDIDPLACQDFRYLTGVDQICADIAKLTPADVRKAFGHRAPNVVFSSAPCVGASALLSSAKAKTDKYRQLNDLSLVWARLMISTWKEPPALLLFENVPRLPSRAPETIRELRRMLKRAGYVLTDSSHDCGELGGLGQRRRRWLLVARHPQRCPPLLYQPPIRRVRGCGEVLSQLPVPATLEARAWGQMHTMPRLAWVNWVRLALIPAGGDWRDLAGVLAADQARREVFKRHGVEAWDEPTGTVAADTGSNGVANVADPRPGWFKGVLGVTPWADPSSTVTGESRPSNGEFAVADPRIVPQAGNVDMHWGKYKVHGFDEPALTVHGASRVGSGAPSVADPRVRTAYDAGYAVLSFDQPARTIAGKSAAGCGAYAVADPRLGCEPRAGAYGCLAWDQAAKVITGSLQVDNGFGAVADPRKPPDFTPVIIAADGTWHRPLTTLELAALQGFPLMVDGKPLQLAGKATRQRRAIGNAVPAPAARAIAERMLVALTEGATGSFSLSSEAVWVDRQQEARHG